VTKKTRKYKEKAYYFENQLSFSDFLMTENRNLGIAQSQLAGLNESR